MNSFPLCALGLSVACLAGAPAHAAPRHGAAQQSTPEIQQQQVIPAVLPQPRLFVDIFAYTPAPATSGDNVQLMFGIKNSGDGGAGAGDYVLWLDCKNLAGAGPACPFTKNSQPLPAIAKGQTHNLTLVTQPWPAGDYRITAWAEKTGSTKGPHHRPWHKDLNVAEAPDPRLQYKQPIPAESGFVKPGQPRGFNPQPEPPAGPKAGFVKPGEAEGFNPQPDPPGPSR